jgi:3-dehydroquinate synthase
MLLNLGHTFGHAIETLQAYKGFKHGEAVAIGMCMAADLSAQIGKISELDAKRANRLIASFGLPTKWPDFKVDEFIQVMQGDKKNTSATQRFILLKKLGDAYVDESIGREQIEQVLTSYL